MQRKSRELKRAYSLEIQVLFRHHEIIFWEIARGHVWCEAVWVWLGVQPSPTQKSAWKGISTTPPHPHPYSHSHLISALWSWLLCYPFITEPYRSCAVLKNIKVIDAQLASRLFHASFDVEPFAKLMQLCSSDCSYCRRYDNRIKIQTKEIRWLNVGRFGNIYTSFIIFNPWELCCQKRFSLLGGTKARRLAEKV